MVINSISSYHLWTTSILQAVIAGNVKLATSIRHQTNTAPKWKIRIQPPQQMAGLEDHYEKQIPIVLVRPINIY